MSCGEPHETDCSEVLDHLYEYLDQEMPDGDCAKFKEHFDECSPCFEKYGLEREVKKLVKRCCGHDDVPSDLRAKVMGRIEVIRQGQGQGPREGDTAQGEEFRSAAGEDTRPAAGEDTRPAAGEDTRPAAGMETVDAVGSEDDKNPA